MTEDEADSPFITAVRYLDVAEIDDFLKKGAPSRRARCRLFFELAASPSSTPYAPARPLPRLVPRASPNPPPPPCGRCLPAPLGLRLTRGRDRRAHL